LGTLLDQDIDDDSRPTGAGVDIGADEFVPGAGLLNVCSANMDLDIDVDGADLVNTSVPAAIIAIEFGRTNCLQ
jgi:hypothetical protein